MRRPVCRAECRYPALFDFEEVRDAAGLGELGYRSTLYDPCAICGIPPLPDDLTVLGNYHRGRYGEDVICADCLDFLTTRFGLPIEELT